MAEENQVINSEAYLKKLGGLYGKVTNRIKKMEAAMKTADSFAAATTKLNALNSGLEQQEALQASVYRAAQRTRSAFSDFANVVSTLGTAAPNAFEDSSGLVSFAETVRKAIALSGADAAGQLLCAAAGSDRRALPGRRRQDQQGRPVDRVPQR